jgi:copper homeostasis protein
MALLEVCVDSLAGALAAQAGGAERIELCARLDLGGLSPPAELLDAALARAVLPHHVMVRPRAGEFVYSRDELDAMQRQIAVLHGTRARGVVLGMLTPGREIDVEGTARLVARARPLAVTFHRAFDEVRDLEAALETLIELGVERVLTSGGAATAFEGRSVLRKLVARAAGRIVVMPGGGVRAHNAAQILADTGAGELHSSTVFRLQRKT